MGQIRVQCPTCRHQFEMAALPAPNAQLTCVACGHRFPFRLTKASADHSRPEPPLQPPPASWSRPAESTPVAGKPLPPIVVPPTAPVAPAPVPHGGPLPPANVPQTSVVLDGKTLMLGGAGVLIGVALLIAAIMGSVVFLVNYLKPATPPVVQADSPAQSARKVESVQASASQPTGETTNPNPTVTKDQSPPAKTDAGGNRADAQSVGPAPPGMLGTVSVSSDDGSKEIKDAIGAWVVGKRHLASHAVVLAMLEKQIGPGCKMTVKTANGANYRVMRRIWHPEFEFAKFQTEPATREQALRRAAHAVVLLEVDDDLPRPYQVADAKACEVALTKKAVLSANLPAVGGPGEGEGLPMRTLWPKLTAPEMVKGRPGKAAIENLKDQILNGCPIVNDDGRVVAIAYVDFDLKPPFAPTFFGVLSAERVLELMKQIGSP